MAVYFRAANGTTRIPILTSHLPYLHGTHHGGNGGKTKTRTLNWHWNPLLCWWHSSVLVAQIRNCKHQETPPISKWNSQWSHNLLLQLDKHEDIIFTPSGTGSGKRKMRIEIERVKWLGIIIDETLDFDYHWKSRVDKACKLLGACSSIGSSQWEISPGSWRQLYTGMVPVVALWRAELWCRGQKDWKKEFERLQYQALRKYTGAVLGANRQKVNAIAALVDVDTILQAIQTRYMARCMADPSTTADI